MPKPMHRSKRFRRLDRVTAKNRHVLHFEAKASRMPRCPICKKELNGISRRNKGRSTVTNARKFGGALCAACTSNVIKLASRIEQGEMKLNDISITERQYVLQMMSH